MAIRTFNQPLFASRFTFFSEESLQKNAIQEQEDEKEADQSSSQGRNRLTPYDETNSSRYYRFLRDKLLKSNDIEELINILKATPNIATLFLKNLLKDSLLGLEKKKDWLSTIDSKIGLSQLSKDENILENIQKILPQKRPELTTGQWKAMSFG